MRAAQGWRALPLSWRFAVLVGCASGVATAAVLAMLAITVFRAEMTSAPLPALLLPPICSGLAAAVMTRVIVALQLASPLRILAAAMTERRRALPPEDDLFHCAEVLEVYDRYNHVIDGLEIAETELRGRRKELERANAANSRFLSIMSHELRTPLNGVLGMAQLLNISQLSERQRDIVSTILSSGGALSDVIDDVLDVAKIEAGLLELSYDLFNLEQTARSALASQEALADLKGLAIVSDFDIPENMRFIGDAKRVKQVVSKLVGNGVKFTDKGQVRVAIRCDAPFGARIEVSDSGAGVPADHRELIFERFRQADDGDTRRHGGAGLGLAICKDLVELMGGRIGVGEAELGGALFWVELPLEQIETADAGDAAMVACGGGGGETLHMY